MILLSILPLRSPKKKLNNIPEVRNPACHDREVVTCLILRKFIEI